MRELELAGHPAIDSTRPRERRAPSPRTAFVVSIVVHALAVYALAFHPLADAPSPPRTVAAYFVLEVPAPPPEPVPEPEPVPVEPPVEQREIEPPEPADVADAEHVPVGESVDEAERAAVPQPTVDFGEESRRAAREVVAERSAESEYLTFTMDDVASPRAEPEEGPKRSIFDGGGGADFGGRSVGTVGQQRTKFGRKLAELCNALTGGFGVAFMGFGLFSACASPDTGPSGLFPEVRPAYLDLMPECVDTRDTAPALALEAPFPTVKCRLVKREDVAAEP